MPEAPNIHVHWDWWRENLSADAQHKKTHGYVFQTDTLPSPVWFYGINRPSMVSAGEVTERLCTDYPEVDEFSRTGSYYYLHQEKSFWGCWLQTSSYPELEGMPYYERFIRFPARKGEKTEFLVSGAFRSCMVDPKDFLHSDKRFAELHWFSASDDYDRYLTDSWHYGQKATSKDLADIFLRENIYSNIQGGIGIFGAKSERRLLWDDDRYWGDGMFFLPGLDQISYFFGTRYPYRDFTLLQGMSPKPFRMLLYEVRNGLPEEWKYGGENPDQFYCLKNEDQLREHGIAMDDSIDFTVQNVWVMYSFAYHDLQLPMMVSVWENDRVVEGVGRYDTMRCVVGYVRLQGVPTTSRIALVVDKLDEDLYDQVYFEFLPGDYVIKSGYEDTFWEVMRQLGVEITGQL